MAFSLWGGYEEEINKLGTNVHVDRYDIYIYTYIYTYIYIHIYIYICMYISMGVSY